MTTTLALGSVQAIAALVVLLACLAPALAQRQPSPASPPLPPGVLARPGCRDTCGNITVPYPFGIGAGCYRDDGTDFQLFCDDARSPPRLSLTSGGYQLASLSLAAGEARIYLNATRKCYNTTTGEFVRRNDDASMALGEGNPYRISANKTRLFATGCPTIGYFVDGDGYFVSGCTSVCRPAQYAIAGPGQGSCTGVGCCQSAIPPGLSYYEPNTFSLQQGQLDPIFNNNVTTCQYVILADADWFSYSDRVFFNRTDDFATPVVLDWAVRNVGNCSAAQRNMTDYACRSGNSDCVPSTNGAGYRCNCSQGYEGNPYLDGGCRGSHMDRHEGAADANRQDAKRMGGAIQARPGSASGCVFSAAGTRGTLATSDSVEGGGGDKLIIRVGAIGCSAFGLKCSSGPV